MEQDEVGDEVTLVMAVRRGDHEAFGALYDRHGPLIYRYCYRHGVDPSQAEDLLSIVFLEAWRCRERIAVVDGSARAWLLGVAKNLTRARARAHRRHAVALRRYAHAQDDLVHPDHAPIVDEQVSAASTVRALWVQIALFPVAKRQVAELCLLEGFTIAQAAAALGQRKATIKSRLYRVRRRLQSVARTSEAQVPRATNGHVRVERVPRASIGAKERT